MIIPKKYLLVAGLFASAFALTLRAIPIQITFGPVNTQPANNGTGTVTTWATDAIAAYNALPLADVPVLPAFLFRTGPTATDTAGSPPVGFPADFGANINSVYIPAGFSYVVLSWGGSTIPGDHGTAEYLYYLGGSGGTFTDNGIGISPALAGGGLSGIIVYNAASAPNVPDGGSTIALLGFGLASLALIRRKFKRD